MAKTKDEKAANDASVIRKGEVPTDTPVVQGAGFDYYRKNVLTMAKQMDEDFQVEVESGDIVQGKAGDYLALDEQGYPYPIDRAIFLSSYVPVAPAKRDTQAVGSA